MTLPWVITGAVVGLLAGSTGAGQIAATTIAFEQYPHRQHGPGGTQFDEHECGQQDEDADEIADGLDREPSDAGLRASVKP